MDVKLTPFSKKHLKFLKGIWCDPEVNEHTGMPKGGVEMDLWLKQYEQSKRAVRFASEQYIITLDGIPVGETAFGMLPRGFVFGTWEKDPSRRCALADIKLIKRSWGRGIAHQALLQLIDNVFEKTGAMDIITIPNEENERALRLYGRSGFHDTGDSNPQGNLVYIMSREDWESDKSSRVSH